MWIPRQRYSNYSRRIKTGYWFNEDKKKFLKESSKNKQFKPEKSIIPIKYGYNLHYWF